MGKAYSPLGKKAKTTKGYTTAKLSDIKPMMRTKVGLKRNARLGAGKPKRGLIGSGGWKNPL